MKAGFEHDIANMPKAQGAPVLHWCPLSFYNPVVTEIYLAAEPTGFEPALSCVTGRRVGPLHYGSLYATCATYGLALSGKLNHTMNPGSLSRTSRKGEWRS